MIRPNGLRASTALPLVAAACLATEARASLLVYESFTGYTSGTLEGQKPNANTTGLDKNVGYYDGAATSRAGRFTLTTGLSLGSLAVSGGALAYATGTNVIGADISIGAAFTGTLWTSYLTQITTRGSLLGDGALLRVGDSPSDSSDIRYTSWADSRGGLTGALPTPNLAVGYAGTTPSNSDGSLTLGITYIILGRFTNVGASSGVATLWALDQTQFAAFLAAGGTESALAGTSVTATATQNNPSTARNFITTDAFALITANGTGVFDEIRFGSSLGDVAPIAVPEPSNATAFAGLAALLATFLPRRRRR